MNMQIALLILSVFFILALLFFLFIAIRDRIVTLAQRNELIWVRSRESDYISNGGLIGQMPDFYAQYDALPRDRMIWMVSKWTHSHFYPK